MAKILWCRHATCKAGYGSVGDKPDVCPACLKKADWITVGPPRFPYVVTGDDRRFLRFLAISVET